MYKYLTITIIIFLSTVTFAKQKIVLDAREEEKKESSKTISDEEELVIDLSNRLTIKPYLGWQLMNITYSKNDRDLEFQPKTPALIGLSLSYKWLGIGYSFRLPVGDEFSDIPVKTTYQDFQITYYGYHFGFDLYDQYYKGFYLTERSSEITELGNEKTTDVYPELRINNFYANFYYIFSPERFSLDAAFDQTSIQKETGGSLIAMLTFSHTFISNDKHLVPEEYEQEFDRYSKLNGANLYTLTISPGYASTIVFEKHWYLTLFLAVGLGLQKQELSFEDDFISRYIGTPRINARLAFGYNDKDYFYGLSFVGDVNISILDTKQDLEMTVVVGNIQLFGGFRLF